MSDPPTTYPGMVAKPRGGHQVVELTMCDYCGASIQRRCRSREPWLHCDTRQAHCDLDQVDRWRKARELNP